MSQPEATGTSLVRTSIPLSSLRNFAWLVGGRLLRMGLSLTVGAWVARHLGPAEFGELSYLIALVALPVALVGMGLDGLIVRDLVEQHHDPGETLGTAFGLRLGVGLLTYGGLVAAWWFLRGDDGLGMIALLGLELLFQSANVFDLHFQAKSANRWTVLAGTVSLGVTSVVRITLILTGAPLVYFAAAVMLEGLLQAIFFATFYRHTETARPVWRFRSGRARALLGESWPMIISAVAIAGCMRVDQVMLRAFSGEAAVGVYAAAVRLAEVWYFIPMFLGTALNPWILEGRRLGSETYRRRLVRFYAGMLWSSAILAGGLAALSGPMVGLLYGEDYLAAAGPLRIHLIGGIFLALGVAAGKWYVAEGHTVGLMRKALLGLAVNLAGNAVLIPRYGANGAAAAAAAGHFAANVLYDMLDGRVRSQLPLKLGALAPWNLRQR